MPELTPEQRFTAALIKLQAALPRITKTDKGQSGNRETTYANLATITDSVLPLLCEHGFLWTCLPTMSGAQFVLAYRLSNEAVVGYALEGEYPLPSANPQTMGGAITYARRYALNAVLNIAPAEDDDDAQRASRVAEARQERRSNLIAEERAVTQPFHRPAERLRGPLPDDEFSTPDPSAVRR